MTLPNITRRILSSRSKSIITPFSSTAAHPSISPTKDATVGGASRAYSQQHTYHASAKDVNSPNFVWGMASVAAATTLMGISSSQETRCESAENDPQGETENEVDPYDNLPEEDEATHCSICLTYRQVGFCFHSVSGGSKSLIKTTN